MFIYRKVQLKERKQKKKRLLLNFWTPVYTFLENSKGKIMHHTEKKNVIYIFNIHLFKFPRVFDQFFTFWAYFGLPPPENLLKFYDENPPTLSFSCFSGSSKQGPIYEYGDWGQKYFGGPLITKPRIVIDWLVDWSIVVSQLVEYGLIASY